jgi:acetoin utilization deacetylase AcuC-like enzyme
MARAAVVHSPRYECDIGTHVFPMRKYGLILGRLLVDGMVRRDEVLAPEPAGDDVLLGVHTAEYLADLAALRWTPRTRDSELPLTREVVDAYRLMVGGTLLATREALARGFAVHLGGGFHHAFADRAAGFCYLNDIAVAIRALQREGRIRRAAVVDVDLHQGDGTARIFAGDPDVFTFSIHQERLFPEKQRSDLDIGLDDGADDEAYLARLEPGLTSVWAHAPELIVVQAGADPFTDDQLGALRLTFAGLERRDRMVLAGCAERNIPVAVTLGGGYARSLDDLVLIHARTAAIVIELAGRHEGRVA